MGWHNPPISWSEHERRLADASRPVSPEAPTPESSKPSSPTRSFHRQPYQAPELIPGEEASDHVEYAELHMHSSFSFLDGVSAPQKLVERGAQLGLEGLAITDHNGMRVRRRLLRIAPPHTFRCDQ